MRPLWLFDFDGVIADSLDAFEGTVQRALKDLGYDFVNSVDEFKTLFKDNLYNAFEKHGVSKEHMDKVFDHIRDNVDFSKIRLHEGMKELLIKARELVNVAIVSSNDETQIIDILSHNQAADIVPVILGYHAGRSKVKKITAAMRTFGTDPSNTFYVVDTVGDVREAKEALVKTVVVAWGWHDLQLLSEYKPEYMIGSPDELMKMIEMSNLSSRA